MGEKVTKEEAHVELDGAIVGDRASAELLRCLERAVEGDAGASSPSYGSSLVYQFAKLFGELLAPQLAEPFLVRRGEPKLRCQILHFSEQLVVLAKPQ